MGEIPRRLPDNSPRSPAVASRYCAERAQNLSGPCSPRQRTQNAPVFTFGGVVAERVNTAKTRRKLCKVNRADSA